MEKADILEMTVAHLKSLPHHHMENDPKLRDHESSRCHDSARYVLGFRECASEVEKYIATLNTVDRPGVEALSSLIQYLRVRTEDVQKAARNGSDQLHQVLDTSSFFRAERLMQFQASQQPSNIVAHERNEFQTTGTACFRVGDSSVPAGAATATRYILGQLPYLQHPYVAALTSSLPMSNQNNFATAAMSTLANKEHAHSPRQGDEFPQTLSIRIPRGSGIPQCPRDPQISPDSGLSLDSPTQIYRSKTVKSESMVEFSPQSIYNVKPSSRLETTAPGPSSDCPWRPW